MACAVGWCWDGLGRGPARWLLMGGLGADVGRRWRRLVQRATGLAPMLAGCVLLEGMLAPEALPPAWALRGYPAPPPSSARTLSAVWLRLEAFQAALRPPPEKEQDIAAPGAEMGLAESEAEEDEVEAVASENSADEEYMPRSRPRRRGGATATRKSGRRKKAARR